MKTVVSKFPWRNLPELGCCRLSCHIVNLTNWKEIWICDISLCLACFEPGIPSYCLISWLRNFTNNFYFTMFVICPNRISYVKCTSMLSYVEAIVLASANQTVLGRSKWRGCDGWSITYGRDDKRIQSFSLQVGRDDITLWTPRCRLEGNVTINRTEQGVDWVHLTPKWDRCRALTNTAISVKVLLKRGISSQVKNSLLLKEYSTISY
jgi:hypothetical protein